MNDDYVYDLRSSYSYEYVKHFCCAFDQGLLEANQMLQLRLRRSYGSTKSSVFKIPNPVGGLSF